MDAIAPATGTALLLLVAFVLPGFIVLVTRESTYQVKDATTPFERLMLSLSYSVRIYGILLLVVWIIGWHDKDISSLYHGKRPLGDYILLAFLALLVLPVSMAECGRWWKKSRRLRPLWFRLAGIPPSHSTPSGWEHFFGSNRTALVRITMDDGRVIGGYFGARSFAAYTADTQDLFLEERWELDGDAWFTQPAPLSYGLWVPHEHIVSLEVYAPTSTAAPTAFERAAGVALTAATLVSALRPDATTSQAASRSRRRPRASAEDSPAAE